MIEVCLVGFALAAHFVGSREAERSELAIAEYVRLFGAWQRVHYGGKAGVAW